MGTLVKFCKKKHNILDSCHTIRFGTLEYYREMDPAFCKISDADEGQDSVHVVRMDTATADPEAVEQLPLIGLKGRSFYQNVTQTLTHPNCYIWCCSKVTTTVSAEKGTEFDPDYDSSYAITDPSLFAERLCALLLSLTSSAFVQDLSIKTMRELSLVCYHHPVFYVDEKTSTIDEGHLSPYVREIPQPFRHIFAKQKEYEKQREYRFAFVFQHPRHGQLAVRKNPVNIPILPVENI